MSKSTTIKSLLVIPLIASSILLASPALAANSSGENKQEIIGNNHKKHGVHGTVASIRGNSITVTTKHNGEYTVDASGATIMKASKDPKTNPDVINVRDINVGDVIVARGTINADELVATKIFDGDSQKEAKKGLHWFRKHMTKNADR